MACLDWTGCMNPESVSSRSKKRLCFELKGTGKGQIKESAQVHAFDSRDSR